jgi:AcrR family transcriptional regulator
VGVVAETGAREQMIAAAERIAVERGVGAMSLREVQAASGQRNKSAAHYHFGSREGLIEAVVAARMGPVNERRHEMLAALDAAGPPVPLRALVAALVEPLAEHTAARPGSRWARFLAQGMADPALSEIVQRNLEGTSYRAVRARLVSAIDGLPRAWGARRVDQATGLAVMSLAAAEAAADGHDGAARAPGGPDPADLIVDLVDVCTAVVAAPSSLGGAAMAGRQDTEQPGA